MQRRQGRSWGTLLVLLLPAVATAASLTLEQDPIVLGRTASVGVLFHVEEPPGTEGRPLRVAASVGSFGPVRRVRPGEYRSEYRPPSTRFPQLALVMLWRETGPEAPLEFLRLPLHGATRLPVRAPPGARVEAEVGAQTFGPVVTGRHGRARIALVVPPGVREATVRITDAQGEVTRRRVPIAVPPYNRLALAVVPHALVADGRGWARVDVLYDVGRPVRPEEVRLVASLGQAEFVRAEPDGRLVYRYQPPAGTHASEVTFEARVAGDARAEARARLSLGLPPVASIQVLPPERPLVADGRSPAPVRVRVLDDDGLGLPGQRLQVRVGGRFPERMREERPGEYVVEVVAPPESAGQTLPVTASVERADGQVVTGSATLRVGSGGVPHTVTVQVSPATVMASGASRSLLTFEVRDPQGQPLTGAQLQASASVGQVGPLVEESPGRYRAEYTAPDVRSSSGEVQVQLADASGAHSRTVRVSLRSAPRLLVGVRGGAHHLLETDGVLHRVGVEVWAPFRLGGAALAVGLSGHRARVPVQPREGATGDVPGAHAVLWPVALRLGSGLYVTPDVGLYAGAGALVAWARVDGGTGGEPLSALAQGGLAFLAGALTVGPGQLFTELTYTYAPLRAPRFRLQAGGLSAEMGYRLALF